MKKRQAAYEAWKKFSGRVIKVSESEQPLVNIQVAAPISVLEKNADKVLQTEKGEQAEGSFLE